MPMGLNHIPAASGIYAIVNRRTGHRYVDQASNMRDRAAQQYRALLTGTHHTHGRRTLQDAWNAYGADAFDFIVLEFVDDNRFETNFPEHPDNLSLAEQYYVDQQSEYNPDKLIVQSRHRPLVESQAWRVNNSSRLENLKKEIANLTNIERRALRNWMNDQVPAREVRS